MPTATTHPRTAPVEQQPPFEAAFSCVEQQGMDNDERSAEQAGFDDDNDVPTETPGTEAAPEQQEPEQPAPVEYAQLTQADVEELRGWKPAQEKLAGMAFGKIGGLERRFSDQDQAAAKANELRAKITPEKIASLRDDGFDVLADSLEIFKGMPGLPVSVGVAPEKVDEIVQQRVAAALESVPTVVDQNVQKILLSRQHKDWSTVTQSPEFAVFTKTLPPAEQQELATTWDSDFIGNVLTKFKASKAPPTQRRSRAEAAVIPRGSGVTHNAVMSDEKSGFDAA